MFQFLERGTVESSTIAEENHSFLHHNLFIYKKNRKSTQIRKETLKNKMLDWGNDVSDTHERGRDQIFIQDLLEKLF